MGENRLETNKVSLWATNNTKKIISDSFGDFSDNLIVARCNICLIMVSSSSHWSVLVNIFYTLLEKWLVSHLWYLLDMKTTLNTYRHIRAWFGYLVYETRQIQYWDHNSFQTYHTTLRTHNPCHSRLYKSPYRQFYCIPIRHSMEQLNSGIH